MSHRCDPHCTHESERFYADANKAMDGVGLLLCIGMILFLAWMTFSFGAALLHPEPLVSPLGMLLGFVLCGYGLFLTVRGLIRRLR